MNRLTVVLGSLLVVTCGARALGPTPLKDGDERLATRLEALRRTPPTSIEDFLARPVPFWLNKTTTVLRKEAKRAQYLSSGDNVLCYVGAATTTSGAWGAWGYDCEVTAPEQGPALAKRIVGKYAGNHIRFVAGSPGVSVTIDDPDPDVVSAFELLASPGNYVDVAHSSCPAEMVPGRAAADLLFQRHKIGQLRRLALGLNPEGTVYGIRALLDSPDASTDDRALAQRLGEEVTDALVAEVMCHQNKPPRPVPGMHSASGWKRAGEVLMRMAPFKMP